MAIIININSNDQTNVISQDGLQVVQNITSQVDTAQFVYRKYGDRSYSPSIGDEVEIYDGASIVFSGEIIEIQEKVESSADGLLYSIKCVDHTQKTITTMFSQSYTSTMKIEDIITDFIGTYMTGFTTNNVVCGVSINRIIFNQVSVFDALRRLADLVKYQFYVDENKDVHFFPKFENSAPYNLTDTSGNYIVQTLQRKIDGSQIYNSVIVRGGEYNASTFTDEITVSGNDTKSFNLPYKMANLTVEVDTGAGYVSKTVGIDFIDDFSTRDILYNYNDKTFRFENPLSDGDKIRFSGSPKVRVLAIAEDSVSIATYGRRQKLIRDNTIEDNDVARKRAMAEIGSLKDEKSVAKFNTYTSGLRVGQVIKLDSDKRSVNTDFIIKKLTFSIHTHNTFKYAVEMVTTEEYGLIELLQSLMRPDPSQGEENEVGEKLQTNQGMIAIAESITNVSPTIDSATIGIAEVIDDDPLGDGVEPIWVLGPYFPSSMSDPKRVGILDRSLKVY